MTEELTQDSLADQAEERDNALASSGEEDTRGNLKGNDDWLDEERPVTDDDPDEQEEQAGDDADMISVAVDWVELEGALENNSPELHSFLNTATGDVIRIFDGSENSEARLKEAEASPEDIYIEPVSSREQYRWMEEFIEIVEEPTLKDKLNIAIDGKGAFRRFKDVLVGYPSERERWFQKRSAKLRTHMTTWLTSKKVSPANIPPWEEDPDAPREPRRQRSEAEGTGWREGSADLRASAHELVDLVPPRELPTAVAFLEFLRNRRGFRRSRFS